MSLRNLDLNKLSRLISEQVEHVTCIECSKYYKIPTTASCGHTLCHSCWKGRRNCAECGKHIEKNNLKLNISLQSLSEHVSILSYTFEDLFNIILDEYLLDAPAEIIPEGNKNVKERSASSQNQFSASVTSSTESTQDMHTEQITSDIQIHTTKKISIPREVVHVPLQQDDWDKIEEMPDAEENTINNQENVVGPMDIEPFEFIMDDEEHTSCNLHLSSRQKENNTASTYINPDLPPHKNSKDSNKYSEKKFIKVAKNWNNAENDNINEDVNTGTDKNMIINTVNTINKTNENFAHVNNKVPEVPRVCFLKKSSLYTKPLEVTDNIQIEANKPSTNIFNNDDIEITIKIGNTLTNICIKKKDNDVHFKINSDREVQISSTTVSEPKTTVTEKSVSKKNTASADTTTVQFDITESIEKEITKSLDFNEISGKKTNKKNSLQQNKPIQDDRSQSQKPLRILDEIPEDMDLDIIDGESVKEGNIISLKSAKNTSSAILPSINSTKVRTPLTNGKKVRDLDDVNDLPSSKKLSLSLTKTNKTAMENQDIKDSDDITDETQTHIQHHTTDKTNATTDLEVMELCTPVQDEDSGKSVVKETPQKSTSFSKKKNKSETTIKSDSNNNITIRRKLKIKQAQNMQTEDINVINLSYSSGDSIERSKKNIIVLETEPRITLETPVTITNFVDQIKRTSTPLARKSLNINNDNCDPELTICPSAFVLAQTTQEKEFLSKSFEHTLDSEKYIRNSKASKFCLAGSCLSATKQSNVKFLCSQKKWTYVEKYTKDITHLVVGVDEENKSQRSVKYMCALAGGKWIISYEWIEKCLETNVIVDEEQFEALDDTGEPGPRRSRLAKQKLFTGISFYCMPPCSMLNIDTLKDILLWSGGVVLSEASAARAGERPALVLAEPEPTQEDRFIYLAMELNVVPVNYEWVFNCLGSYILDSILELLLCPSSLLPPVVSKWPPDLISCVYE